MNTPTCFTPSGDGIGHRPTIALDYTDSTTQHYPSGGDGIYLTRSDAGNRCESWRIYRTELIGCGRNGISVIAARNCVSDGLIISDCGYCGIDIEPNGPNDVNYSLTIANCIIAGSGFYGMVISGSKNPKDRVGHVMLTGNVIQFTQGQHFSSEKYTGAGLYIDSSESVVAIGNILRANGTLDSAIEGYGVLLLDASNFTLVANHIIQPGPNGKGGKVIKNSVPSVEVTLIGNLGFNDYIVETAANDDLRT